MSLSEQTTKHALISVYNKDGLEEFALSLKRLGYRLYSSGGTAQYLRDHGIETIAVEEYTGFPEILGGRVKTLHPKIHAGLLADQSCNEHVQQLQNHDIIPFSLVVVNLYPFLEQVSDSTRNEEGIELIDIGGPTMIRAAAKNYKNVTVVVDPMDYTSVIQALDTSGPDYSDQAACDQRRRYAEKAFALTAYYDSCIAKWINRVDPFKETQVPRFKCVSGHLVTTLRYGENPHQRANLYSRPGSEGQGVIGSEQLGGKPLSFNNIQDLESAYECLSELYSNDHSVAVIIKHMNPCGVAIGKTCGESFERALSGNPEAAFGGILALSHKVDLQTAQAIHSRYFEAVLALDYDPDALECLKSKKNLRVLKVKGWADPREAFEQCVVFRDGFLVQESDALSVNRSHLRCVTQRHPTQSQLEDLLFAEKVCKHVKSNAIVCAGGLQALGVGAGQMSRIGALSIAMEQSKRVLLSLDRDVEPVVASDAFFPFKDSVLMLHESGVQAVVQPGGSIRDREVIEEADRLGMTMVFTSLRHFTH